VDGIFVSFPCYVNTQREIIHEISKKYEVNDCQFAIPLGIVYICMVLLGIMGIPIFESLDTAGTRMGFLVLRNAGTRSDLF
jgi:hypothetical protein